VSEEILAGLDAFPNVLKKIQGMWGTKELDKFIHSLLMDSRGGTRQGFPVDAAEELLFVVKFNKRVRAIDVAEKLQIPVQDAYRIVDKADQAQLEVSPWADPNSSNEASARQRSEAKGSIKYTVVRPKPSNGNGLLFWLILIVAIAAAVKFLLPKLAA